MIFQRHGYSESSHIIYLTVIDHGAAIEINLIPTFYDGILESVIKNFQKSTARDD